MCLLSCTLNVVIETESQYIPQLHAEHMQHLLVSGNYDAAVFGRHSAITSAQTVAWQLCPNYKVLTAASSQLLNDSVQNAA